MSTLRHIAVEGPIGVGKTSLVKLLAQHLDGVEILEDMANPFLSDFYAGRPGAEFQVQLYFLLTRFQQQRNIAQMDLFRHTVLADYTFVKDRIFAYLNLGDDDLRLYEELWTKLQGEVPKPDLVIYMQASLEVLVERIKRRDRDYERAIDHAYLERLSEAYSSYFFHYSDTPLLVVNTDDIDFVHSSADREALFAKILEHRRGTQIFVPHHTRQANLLVGLTDDEEPR